MEVGVQVAVGLLHSDDVGDHGVERFSKLGVWGGLQGIVAGFQPFGDVGIPEDVAAAFVFRLEGVEASGLFAHFVVGRDAANSVRFDPGSPERIVDLDVFEKHRFFGLGENGGHEA